MANLGGGGGGAEAQARLKQYEYRANSSLVLTTDSPLPPHDGTLEPQSLWGKINPKNFGDRAKPRNNLKKSERDPLAEPGPASKRRRLSKEESVLTLTEEEEEGVYLPKSRETRVAYEAFLSVIQQQLGGQPLGVVRGAADEILALLNGFEKKEGVRREVEKLLDPIADNVFDQLVSIGRLITDYQDGSSGEAFDEEIGVAVVFDDEDEDEEEEEESELDMGQEEDEEEEEDAVAGVNESGVGIEDNDDDDDMEEASEGLSVHDIDAYWLQRKISQDYDQRIDPQQRHMLAELVLDILAEGDDMEVESKLLQLGVEQLGLVKFLLRNRVKIVWCTRLARAEGEEERKRMEEEMVQLGPDSAAVLEELRATRASAEEREKSLKKSIREEARRLKGGEKGRRGLVDVDSGSAHWFKGQSRLLDLDSNGVQHGRVSSNHRCGLADGSYRSLGKGYEEVHVPALKPKPFDPDEKLVKISSMPEWAQPAFKGLWCESEGA